MLDQLLSTQAQRVLERSLQATGFTHEVIAHNLANVETPGFKRSEVLFQERLSAALAAQRGDAGLRGTSTNARHLPIGELPAPDAVAPEAVVRAETSLRPDGNNVDMDAEMVKLAQNTMLYQALSQMVGMKLGQLKYAISEGRR